nr:uncharacterized protein LOC105338247 isoform X1 [Crassostrea gigas]XP_034310183.1 uncharacterized protein LOC105338247 isoform X1 [Crassostrea gigas]
MTKKAGHILVLVFLALALAFWIIAMATPGWFVFDIMVDISQIEKIFTKINITLSTSQKILLTEEWYIYKIKCCVSDVCLYVSDNQLNDVNKDLDTQIQAEMVIEKGLAVLLCGLTLLMLIFSDSPDHQAFVVMYLVGVIIDGVLIVRTTVSNASISDFLKKNMNNGIKVPYSIILSGVGFIIAISGFAVSLAMRRMLRYQEPHVTPVSRDQDLSVIG